MKTVELESDGLTLQHVLREADEGGVVFLTVGGTAAYALVKADETDQEVCAIKSNAELMAYLSDCEIRARTLPTKSIEEFRKEMASAPE